MCSLFLEFLSCNRWFSIISCCKCVLALFIASKISLSPFMYLFRDAISNSTLRLCASNLLKPSPSLRAVFLSLSTLAKHTSLTKADGMTCTGPAFMTSLPRAAGSVTDSGRDFCFKASSFLLVRLAEKLFIMMETLPWQLRWKCCLGNSVFCSPGCVPGCTTNMGERNGCSSRRGQ